MNSFVKEKTTDFLATKVSYQAPAVVDISVHGIGIFVFKNKDFYFGL